MRSSLRSWFNLLPVLAMLFTAQVTAQYVEEDSLATEEEEERDSRPFRDRIFWGGGINVGFGTVTNLGISPAVGYKVDRNGRWSVGVGGSYNYLRQNTQNYVWETSIYGYNIFSRYRIIEALFAHAEFSQLSYELYSPFNGNDPVRRWVPFLLLGGGYAANVGGSTTLVFTVLFDVLQDPYSPYPAGQPFVGGGLAVGF